MKEMNIKRVDPHSHRMVLIRIMNEWGRLTKRDHKLLNKQNGSIDRDEYGHKGRIRAFRIK